MHQTVRDGFWIQSTIFSCRFVLFSNKNVVIVFLLSSGRPFVVTGRNARFKWIQMFAGFRDVLSGPVRIVLCSHHDQDVRYIFRRQRLPLPS
jgi:hypothetical protein